MHYIQYCYAFLVAFTIFAMVCRRVCRFVDAAVNTGFNATIAVVISSKNKGVGSDNLDGKQDVGKGVSLS